MKMSNDRKYLYLVYVGIFTTIFILNCLTHRSIGDDYLYSFVWEGHSMYEPLSESARRISSFSDIAESTYSYFMTWGGRIVAQSLAMFFLWLPRMVFNVAISAATVFLVILIQWLARGGRVTMDVSAKEAALIFFCIWAFQANFVGVFIWLDGSCNYLFPMLALLFFLLPYVRHYVSDGKTKEPTWLCWAMFPLGVLAGNSNENTICWIGLFCVGYLYYSYRQKTFQMWMVSGLLGLTLGYGLLMLAPGNWERMVDSKESFENFYMTRKKAIKIWFNTMLQSMLWFYLCRAFRRHKFFEKTEENRKWLHITVWFGVNSWLFTLTMLFSPEFPNRSLFPGFIFCIIAVFTAAFQSKKKFVPVLNPKNLRFNYILAIVYFVFTCTTTMYWYVQEYQYEERVLAKTAELVGTTEILTIEERPPYESTAWGYLTGLHRYGYSMSDDENNWRNVAYARFHHIQGIRLVKE